MIITLSLSGLGELAVVPPKQKNYRLLVESLKSGSHFLLSKDMAANVIG